MVLEAASNDNLPIESIPYNIDNYNWKGYNLGKSFDRFLESISFCHYIWNKEYLSRDSRNFLIYFIQKDSRIDLFTPIQVARIYNEVRGNISMKGYEIHNNIAFFGKFLDSKNDDFQEAFIHLVNEEISSYISTIFAIHFRDKQWGGFDFIQRRFSQTIKVILDL